MQVGTVHTDGAELALARLSRGVLLRTLDNAQDPLCVTVDHFEAG